MIKDIVRWGRTEGYKQTMAELFAHEDPLGLINQAEGKDHEQRAINAFVTRMQTYADVQHVIKYKICSENERRTLFYLVHGSNHFKGFKLMKDIMYNIGIPGMYSYLGPDHPIEGQTFLTPLYEQAELQELGQYLHRKYLGRTLMFEIIMTETYADHPYIEKHYRAAILDLEKNNKVEIFGVRRRAGTLKQDHGVSFL